MKFKEIILNADVCIKLGRFERLLLFHDILPKLANKIYIHRYGYECEVLTSVLAKIKGIPIIMSDERYLQNIINKHLNTGTSNDIKVFRVEDLIRWIKENLSCGINKKMAKAIWLAFGKKSLIKFGQFKKQIT